MHPRRTSSTARLIARCTLLAARDPVRRRLVPPGASRPLHAMLTADGGTGWFDFALRHTRTRAALHALERLMLPGIITHYLARKLWIETMVRQSLARGVTQVVVLGAGFDTLAWRLQRTHPLIRCIELDHPATQAPKRQMLGSTPNLTCVPIDLGRDSPTAALRSCPVFSAEQPTVFIAEGLLMYFGEKRVATLLKELATLTRSPADLLFTFMEEMPDCTIAFRDEHAAIGWWLRWRREPFKWGIAREALPGFLRPLGLSDVRIVDHDILRTRILASLDMEKLPLARGECLCACRANAS